MFNPVEKHLDDFNQFDPASYIAMARKIIAEYEKSRSTSESYLSTLHSKNFRDIKDLYVKLSINRIL